jgi:hypothetical protein
MKLANALRQCAEVERTIAQIYQSFATKWPDSPLASFWRAFAAEEIRHGQLLEEAADGTPETREELIDAGRIAEIRGIVHGFLAVPPSSMDDALGTALDLESLEVEHIYRRMMAVVGDLPHVQGSVGKILREAAHHDEPLLDMIEDYAGDPALRIRVKEERARIGLAAAAEYRPLGFPGPGNG